MDTLILANAMLFLSTLSLRRATLILPPVDTSSVSISIHALLAESDDTSKDVIKTARNFYPRSPCGERPASSRKPEHGGIISIHALLAESDLGRGAVV